MAAWRMEIKLVARVAAGVGRVYGRGGDRGGPRGERLQKPLNEGEVIGHSHHCACLLAIA